MYNQELYLPDARMYGTVVQRTEAALARDVRASALPWSMPPWECARQAGVDALRL